MHHACGLRPPEGVTRTGARDEPSDGSSSTFEHPGGSLGARLFAARADDARLEQLLAAIPPLARQAARITAIRELGAQRAASLCDRLFAGDAARAFAENAAADHVLTDAFSGGHIRTPRERLHARGIRGDVESKVLHDLDNDFGVEVTNRRGDGPWIAYGDDRMGDARNTRNRALALEAVRLSKEDIARALAGEPDERSHPCAPFAAEALVPYPVAAGEPRWTRSDYAAELAHVGSAEGPGMAEDALVDDDHVAAWVEAAPREVLAALDANERERLLSTLLGGVVSERDIVAFERLCAATESDVELARLRTTLRWSLAAVSGFERYDRLVRALHPVTP